MAGFAAPLSIALAAIGCATLLAGLAARLGMTWFLGLVLASVFLMLPSLAASLLLGPVDAAGALTVTLFPLLAWGWRRLPRGQWRTARALGATRARIVRVLVVPPLLPFLLASLLIGAGVAEVRWHLGMRPATLTLPDPVTATG